RNDIPKVVSGALCPLATRCGEARPAPTRARRTESPRAEHLPERRGGPTRSAKASGLKYRRLLLKLSGEALMGSRAYGIDVAVVQRLAGGIKDVVGAGGGGGGGGRG